MANYIHVPDEAPAVPKIDVTVDENDYRADALKLIKELRPNWKPSEVKIKVPLISFFFPKKCFCCLLHEYSFNVLVARC